MDNVELACRISKMNRVQAEADTYKQQANAYMSVLDGTVINFIIPDTFTEIRNGAFYSCELLKNVIIPNTITRIGMLAFERCYALDNVHIPNSVEEIATTAFERCTSLATINIPNSIKTMSPRAFSSCTALENVTLESGFNANSLDLSVSTLYSVETLVAILEALADRTDDTAYTLTLGETNLAKLTDEQKAIATDKNWTLA